MRAVVSLIAVLAGCGSVADAVTSQGVLVDDRTGLFPAAKVEESIALVHELAPEIYRADFAKLDGYMVRILAAKTVDECSRPKLPAAACVIEETALIILADKTCSDYRNKVSNLAHEIGHVLTGPTHDNDDFFAAGGVTDRAQLATCGTLPRP